MKKLLLLGLLLSGCATRSPNQTNTRLTLAEHEILYIQFTVSIEGTRYARVNYDEINWYSYDSEWFILDYKYDPGRWYINLDSIVIWGIER